MEKRYEALGQFYRPLGLEEDAAWVGSRLEKIRLGRMCTRGIPMPSSRQKNSAVPSASPTAADSWSNNLYFLVLDEFPRAEG